MLLRLVKGLVFSNLWVSIAVVSLYFYATLIRAFVWDWKYAFLIFFATLFAYNFQRLIKKNKPHPEPSERHNWIERNQSLVRVLTLVSSIIFVLLGIWILPWYLLLSMLPFGLVVLFYAGVSTQGKWALRTLPFVKIIAISVVWTTVSGILPFLLQHKPIAWELILCYFGFTFALCIPFDVRDIKNDLGTVRTIPTELGATFSKILSSLVLVIVFGVSFYLKLYSLGVVSGISIVLVASSTSNRKELFFTGLIDGMFIFLALLEVALQSFKG